MPTLHHLENSRSHRILWLLEELGVDYELKEYKRDPETMLAPPELKSIHPLGKSPLLTEDGEVIAESAAIIEYLLDTYDTEDRLQPAAGTPDYRLFRFWMHYAEGSAMPPLLLKLVFSQLPRRAPWLIRPIASAINKQVNATFIDPQLRLHMGFWEDELGKHTHFAGEDFSAADIQMSFPLAAALARAASPSDYPRLAAHLERIKARPAYQRAEEIGGPLNLDF